MFQTLCLLLDQGDFDFNPSSALDNSKNIIIILVTYCNCKCFFRIDLNHLQLWKGTGSFNQIELFMRHPHENDSVNETPICSHFLYRILDSKKTSRFQFRAPDLREIHRNLKQQKNFNSRGGFFRRSPFCTFSCIYPGFGGPWGML